MAALVHRDAFEWAVVRESAIEKFREAPGTAVESEILKRFAERPALVVREIDRVSQAVAAGQVRSGWAVLRSRLSGAFDGPELVVIDPSERERRIEAAERWLRNAGRHFDRAVEVVDELFDGPGGDRRTPLLSPWAQDEALRTRMLGNWEELRRDVAA